MSSLRQPGRVAAEREIAPLPDAFSAIGEPAKALGVAPIRAHRRTSPSMLTTTRVSASLGSTGPSGPRQSGGRRRSASGGGQAEARPDGRPGPEPQIDPGADRRRPGRPQAGPRGRAGPIRTGPAAARSSVRKACSTQIRLRLSEPAPAGDRVGTGPGRGQRYKATLSQLNSARMHKDSGQVLSGHPPVPLDGDIVARDRADRAGSRIRPGDRDGLEPRPHGRPSSRAGRNRPGARPEPVGDDAGPLGPRTESSGPADGILILISSIRLDCDRKKNGRRPGRGGWGGLRYPPVSCRSGLICDKNVVTCPRRSLGQDGATRVPCLRQGHRNPWIDSRDLTRQRTAEMGTDAKRERPDEARNFRRFGPSKASVQAAPPQTEAEVVTVMRSLLGRPRAKLQDAANLAGAPDDARVTVAVVSRHGRRVIAVVAENRLIRIEVLLARRVDGKPVLDDELIDVVPAAQRHGLGTNFLGRQLEHAVRLGIAEIRAYAIRGDPGGDVGYRVWPILGFDGHLPRGVIEKLPPGLAAARRVSELMETRERREWWITKRRRHRPDLRLNPEQRGTSALPDLSPTERLPANRTGIAAAFSDEEIALLASVWDEEHQRATKTTRKRPK